MNLKLPGGCESKLDSQLQEEDEDKFSFKSIELQDGFISRRSHFVEVRATILESLCHFLTKRFEIDSDVLETITPFVNFSQNTNI